MISFISLFLGLVIGHQTVAVQVTEPVLLVELHLDGRLAGTIEGPTWQIQIDLGESLVPHELVAIAYDADGVELDRAVQWLNLPRQLAEVTLLLERDPASGKSVARVSWESLTGEPPSLVQANFDGRPLVVEDPSTIELPEYDPSVLHFLRVEMHFAGFLGSSAEITFGGTYTDRVNTDLTAFPVFLKARKKTPSPKSLEGLLRARDHPLQVAAIEKGQAEVYIVRDRGAWRALRQVLSRAYTDSGSFSNSFNRSGFEGRQWFRPDRQAWDSWTFQFFWPVARRQEVGESPYDLFSNSQKLLGSAASLHAWLVTYELPPEYRGPQRLADAVAIAGVTAAGTNRRRGVLLVLGDSPEDASDVRPAIVRQYLTSLAVPLFVWTLDPESAEMTPWGRAEDVSTPRKMQRATNRIFEALDRQRIVWLDGIHLPQEISIAPSTIELATVSAR